MKYTIICSDFNHPVYSYLDSWRNKNKKNDEIIIVQSINEIDWQGKYLFLVSCTEIIKKDARKNFQDVLVFHASDLPKGRGWSPYIWEIEKGAEHITLSILRAEDGIDTGDIFEKINIPISRKLLYHEITDLLFSKIIDFIDQTVKSNFLPEAKSQDPFIEPSYYPRRTRKDSELNANLSLETQFDKIRVCDPNRFPARVNIRGREFKLFLEASDD
jgi:methionyl-tRNA formyltransferase